MKNTIKQLNELRDFFSAKNDYLTALKIGKIISTLLDDRTEMQQINYNEQLELINKFSK